MTRGLPNAIEAAENHDELISPRQVAEFYEKNLQRLMGISTWEWKEVVVEPLIYGA